MTNLSPLTDLIPPKVRAYIYGLVLLAGVVYGAFQVADGDWKQALASLIPIFSGALAVSNTPVVDGDNVDPDLSPDLQGHAEDVDYGETYSEDDGGELVVDGEVASDEPDEVAPPAAVAPAATEVDPYATDLT